ncbi:hypothetical protein QBL02_09445 [Leucobacter sp. UT-8R-CII-1-4]|uniref:hypothetical protein n=1 Tax=Leucobacter sp. UT-8R-CII-1-4 TaxID=3040075 RepID=UPI0024A84DEC|nr:hypothetical protein [Leucobacter sp. UT-8R-CII-1-4]MDI6023771.1 hypothetical protein [Leucobacter sp. UT-8R-CII-1-4]
MLTSERLAQLRNFATIERTAILEYRGREGEDPLTTLSEIPSVDEFVVFELRSELLEERGQLAEFSLARLAGHGSTDEAAEHKRNADHVEFELLREIASACPELTPAVWLVANALDVHTPTDLSD